MRTEYVFVADTGQLVYARRHEDNHVLTVNHRDEHGHKVLCSMLVVENELARREFMNHFGDDSSWPPGWWDRIGRPQFTRHSWARENYAHPPQSWQEYFEVSSPTDRWLKGVKL